MFSVKILSSTAILFGLMMPSALAEPAQSIPSERADTYKTVSSSDWKTNEVLATHNPKEQYSVIDVNDQFIVKSLVNDGITTVRLGVLDGTRERYGSCVTGPKRENGDPSTTWLQISYTKPNADGYRDVTIRRTLDFFGWERVYHVKMPGTLKTVKLDPGVSVTIGNDLLTYTQTTGPIGTSGNTKALRVNYRLSNDYKDIGLSTEMGRKMWRIGTSQDAAADTLAYHVNDIKIDPYQPGSLDIRARSPIVADPQRGPGISYGIDNLVLKVADRSPDEDRDGDVESEDQINQALCNQGLPCSTSFECFTGGGAGCRCAPLSTGPYPSVCLL